MMLSEKLDTLSTEKDRHRKMLAKYHATQKRRSADANKYAALKPQKSKLRTCVNEDLTSTAGRSEPGP